MENYIKKCGVNSAVISILLIVLSLFLIFKPVSTLSFLIIAFGIIIVINGLIHIISYFSIKDDFRAFNFELIQGIISIIIGFVFILQTQVVSSFLPFIVGLWIIIESIIKFQLALNLKDFDGTNWVMMIVLSIITAILGVIILLNPFATAITVTAISGIMLLSSEIINLVESIYLVSKFNN